MEKLLRIPNGTPISNRSKPGSPRVLPAEGHAIAHWTIPAILGISAVGFFIAYLGTSHHGHLQCALALGITAVPFAVSAQHDPGQLIRPLPLTGLSLFLGVGGQVMYLNYVATREQLRTSLYGLELSDIDPALIALGVGVVAMSVGYVSLPHRRVGKILAATYDKTRLGSINSRRVGPMVIGATLASALGFILFAPSVGITNVETLLENPSVKRKLYIGDGSVALGYHRWAMSLASYAFVLGWYDLLASDRRLLSRRGFAVAIAFLTGVVYSVVTSSRADLISIVLLGALVWLSVRRRQPGILATAAGLAIALLIIVVMFGFRAAGQHRGVESVSEVLDARGIAAATLGSPDWFGVSKTAPVIKRVPERYDFQYGRTLFTWAYAPVPRTIWKDKPPVRIGSELGPPIYNHTTPTGMPPGLVGELFVNFGWLGILVGMTLFGTIVRRVDELYNNPPKAGALPTLAYALLTLEIALRLPKGDVTGILLSFGQAVLTLGLFLVIVRDKRTPHKIGQHNASFR